MGIRNLQRWNDGLDRFAKKIETAGVAFQKKVAFLVLGAYVMLPGGQIRAVSGLLQLTPVDTGRAVGNYQLTVGAPSNAVLVGKFGKEGGGASNRAAAQAKASRAAMSALAGLRFGQTIWIVNNLPYIVVLNDGGPNRTAHHMLERAIANARASMRSS